MTLSLSYKSSDYLEIFRKWIVWFLIFFKFAGCFYKVCLAYRERNAILKTKEVPKELEKQVGLKHFIRTKKYHLDCIETNCIFTIYRTLLGALWLNYQGLSKTWAWAGLVCESEYNRTFFFIALATIMKALSNLPYRYYRRFHVEKKHGIRIKEKSKFDFFKREFKMVAAGVYIHYVSAYLFMKFMDWSGELFYLSITIFVTLVELLVLTLLTDLTAPLGKPFAPLPEGQLKKKVEQLADRVKFPSSRILITQGGGLGGGSAYLIGLLSGSRIVLFRSLLKGHNEKAFFKPARVFSADELTAIIAHELGHWHLNHAFQKLLFHQVILFVELLLSSKLMEGTALFEMFGFLGERPKAIGLIISIHVLMEPFTTVVLYLSRVISRCHETEADEFARCQGLGEPLASAFSKFHGRLRVFPNPDPLYVDYYYTHPPLLQRMKSVTMKRKAD